MATNDIPIMERLTKAKVQIQMKNPFFAYMSLYLKFKQDESVGTAGIDTEGNLYYSEKFMQGLANSEIEGVIIHEILHLVLMTATRCGTREQDVFNIASDLAINWIISQNKYELPKGCLVPDYSGNFHRKENGMTIKIDDIPNKTAEEIHEDLLKQLPKKSKDGTGKGKYGKGDIRNEEFDKHFYKEGMSEKEKKAIEKKWEDRIGESLAMARMNGKVPVGLDRVIDKLHEEKIDWRALLNQYITQQIPYNACYSRPHKRSISIGAYIPHQLKEKIEIAVCIDLSGSIGTEEYTTFLSEIVGIARAYQERIDIRFISHDTEAYDGGLVRNGNIEQIKKIQLKGGGGTSHLSAFDLIKDKYSNTKMVIFFTDGYSDLNTIDFNKYAYNKIFVINNGSDEQLKGKPCKIIKMENNRK